MRRFQLSLAIVSLFFLASCAKNIQLVRFEDGLTLHGSANTFSRKVSVIMPDGEVMEGHYSAVSNASFSTAFATGSFSAGKVTGTSTATGFGSYLGSQGNGYALLQGNKGTVMEIIFQFNPLNQHGFGEARTNKGDQYKVIF